jgi:hypothetical protein
MEALSPAQNEARNTALLTRRPAASSSLNSAQLLTGSAQLLSQASPRGSIEPRHTAYMRSMAKTEAPTPPAGWYHHGASHMLTMSTLTTKTLTRQALRGCGSSSAPCIPAMHPASTRPAPDLMTLPCREGNFTRATSRGHLAWVPNRYPVLCRSKYSGSDAKCCAVAERHCRGITALLRPRRFALDRRPAHASRTHSPCPSTRPGRRRPNPSLAPSCVIQRWCAPGHIP